MPRYLRYYNQCSRKSHELLVGVNIVIVIAIVIIVTNITNILKTICMTFCDSLLFEQNCIKMTVGSRKKMSRLIMAINMLQGVRNVRVHQSLRKCILKILQSNLALDWLPVGLPAIQDTDFNMASIRKNVKMWFLTKRQLVFVCLVAQHEDDIKWKHFPCYWLCEGNSPVSGDFSQRSVTGSFDVFFDQRMNKPLK